MKKSNLKLAYIFLGILLIFILWQIFHKASPKSVPALKLVIENITENFQRIYWVNLIVTAKTAFLSLIISFSIAFAIVFSIAIAPKFEFVISPLLILIKATPVVAFVPVIMGVYGSAIESRIISSILVCMFPLVMGGIGGLERVPPKLIILAKVYGSSRVKTFYHFYSGYILESMLSSLKISAPLSLIGAMVAEFLIGGNQDGLGCFLASNLGPIGFIPRFAVIILSAVLGLVFYFTAFGLHKLYEESININK
jgi:NitT/TauT family transport system permease protein